MHIFIKAALNHYARWSNENQGVVSIGLFLATLLIGWITGAFSTFRKKPRFIITAIPGPTFSCTFSTGKKHQQYDVHRTAIAMYLHITNRGNAPSSVGNISIAYHWNAIPFTRLWWRYRVGWFWLNDQCASIEDFQHKIGEHIKFFPFLIQRSTILAYSQDTYLEVGKSTNGVVYFEQPESYGACFPLKYGTHVKVRIKVTDAFGKSHSRAFLIPDFSLEEAKTWNPSFSKTLELLAHPDAGASATE